MNDRVLVARMIAYIEQNLIEPVTAEDMALRSGYSLNRFRQKFYNVTGDTPSGYLRKRRLTEAAKEILAGERIVDVALRWGYSSQENFTTAFRSYFGVTPRELSNVEGKYRRFIRRMREAFTIVEIAGLKQPPTNTTLMGCIQGAMEYFDQDWSTPMLFGLSGHAFLVNIHQEMCPSGPYVWNKHPFYELLRGLGAAAVASYEVTAESSEADRRTVETRLKEHMDAGSVCILDFLEHQLLGGYDENGLLLLQPWNGKVDSELRAISYGSWRECFEHMPFAHLTVLAPADGKMPVRTAAKDALAYGLELYRNPSRHQMDGYRIGYGAYEWWIDAARRGLGSQHGHWWNGVVWSECRRYGAEFFRELTDVLDDVSVTTPASELAATYDAVSTLLDKAKERDVPKDEQVRLLTEARETERRAEEGLAQLYAVL